MRTQILIALFIVYSLNNTAQVSTPPVKYVVPLIPHPTKISCWAGSMAMVISYRNKEEMIPENTFIYVNNPWDINTTFDNDPVEFHPLNSGIQQKVNFNDFAKLFGTWGYDDTHSNYRIIYMSN